MSIPNEQIARLAGHIPFLNQQDDQLKQRFYSQASIIKLQKGQPICHEGNHCSHLSIVLEGTARIYKLGENGKEITLYRISQGESCILTASCILSEIPFPAFAICDTDVEAAIIPANTVQTWLSESAVWRDYIFSLVATRLSNIIHVVEDVVFRKMDRRIATYLCNRAASESTAIRVTHQEIASELGTSREVVSRILKDFEHEDLIKVTRGAIQLIDLDTLKSKQHEQ
ncbi:Crp/Fnr family transcriptional regulator [Sedimenticola selenatireducens]|uniref:Crp/Fnr family transcriptional regulator n=1 Tax=Sedimenticola selenatireducens TaxID=191960 RepID=A0A557SFX1_9GAMM|nr:Crp/Fnr family transcriptional regulator [Sedimenticola selenatireducens]TVO76293.1 Crp/Fnr family transcriptional regulator [Sedimenticola selenatireducens]TVT61403.1 MAG: Crp/Fnr family transcriptional regulator [Sedimenticola selenatireducens]